MLRVYKTTLTSQGIPKILKDFFIKRDIGEDYDIEFRTELALDTSMSLKVIHRRINILLYGSKPVPLKLSDPSHGDLYMYCNSLKQVDLNDVRTTMNKLSCETERGATWQAMILITFIYVLLWALTIIAYRDYTPQHDLTQTMSVDSYVLDVLISTSKISKKELHIQNKSSIDQHISRSGSNSISISSDLTNSTCKLFYIYFLFVSFRIKLIYFYSSPATNKSNKSVESKRKNDLDNSELELHVNLCGATMSTMNAAGCRIYETVNKSNVGRQIIIEASGRDDGRGLSSGHIKSRVFAAVLKNGAYQDNKSIPTFGPNNKIYIPTTRASKQIEHIPPDTNSFWNRIKTFKKRGERHIDISISIGRRKNLKMLRKYTRIQITTTTRVSALLLSLVIY